MLRTGLQAGLRVASRKSNNVGAQRFMSKEIKFGVEGRNAMLVGVNTLADAVQVRYMKRRFFCRRRCSYVTVSQSHVSIFVKSCVRKFHFCALFNDKNGISKMIFPKIAKSDRRI